MKKLILKPITDKLEGHLASLKGLEQINLDTPLHGNALASQGIKELIKLSKREVLKKLFNELIIELEQDKNL